MKDIPEEWVQMAMRAYWDAPGHTKSGVAAAIAAVAPLIAAAEREACAKYHDEAADGERDLASQCGAQNDRQAQKLHQWLEQEHILSAAAIRARSDAP